MKIRCTLVTALLLLPASTWAQQPPAWRLSPQPTLQIGEVDGDSSYQFHRAVSALRLADGRIAVLNAGSSQLRIYDARGKLVSAKGRLGSGPGEFRTPVKLYQASRDTLMVFDDGNDRFTLHRLDGAYLHNRPVIESGGGFPYDEWLYNRSWIDGPQLGKGRAPVRAAIDRLPLPDPAVGFRFVRVSPQGHLWVRQAASPGAAVPWLVYDLAGKPIGSIVTPARFDIHEIGRDYVLGTGRDDLDVEYIQLYRLLGAERAAVMSLASPDTARAPAARKVPESVLQELRGLLRHTSSAQEVFYSQRKNNYTYASTVKQLETLEIPPHLGLYIVRAGQMGWMGLVAHKPSGAMCGIVQGRPAPVGWTPGIVSCE